jgi:hypothetical protein
LFATKRGDHVFTFQVPLQGKVTIRAVAGQCRDTAVIRRISKKSPKYKLRKTKKSSENWV